MPALQLYGRSWKIADDDFVFPEILEGIFRIIWIGIVIYTRVSSHDYYINQCPYRRFIESYIAGVLASGILTAIVAFATAFVSGRGTLANGEARRNIKYFLYTRVPLLLFDLGWAGYGTGFFVYALVKNKEPREGCNDERIMRAIYTTVVGNWVMLALYGLLAYLLSAKERQKKRVTKHEKRKDWDECLNKVFRCGAKQKTSAPSTQGALNDVASLLAFYFTGADLTFTDVLAALKLLKAAQRLEGHPHVQNAKPPPGKPDWMNLHLAARFIRYAAGMYGWPHFTAAYGPAGLYRVYKKMKCPCQNPASSKADIRLDNGCYCNTAVLLEMTDAYGPDVRYFTLHNAIYQVPFSVLIDDQVKSVVVVVRGSLTMEDWVTDLSVVGEEYEIPDGHGGKMTVKGHKGFFESGKYIAEVLRSEGILEKLFQEVPEYSLVVTGQSLGAGVAPPLALYLREWYPEVRCFAYSPPGCVISCNDTGTTLHNIATVVVGDDLVSHMSIVSLEGMKKDIINALKSCEAPKYRVLRCGYRCPVTGDANAERENCDPENQVSKRSKMERSGNMSNSSSGTETSGQSLMRNKLRSEDLCLPGVIMYVFKETDEKSSPWLLSWEVPANFHQIIISSKVIDHHFPFTVCKVLAEAEAQNNPNDS